MVRKINVSELAAAWMPTTRELDVKLAFARQAGDEAGHFQLVADRLTALGFDVASFAQTDNPLFAYLRGLTTTAVGRLLDLAGATRASAAARLGTACFPGC